MQMNKMCRKFGPILQIICMSEIQPFCVNCCAVDAHVHNSKLYTSFDYNMWTCMVHLVHHKHHSYYMHSVCFYYQQLAYLHKVHVVKLDFIFLLVVWHMAKKVFSELNLLVGWYTNLLKCICTWTPISWTTSPPSYSYSFCPVLMIT